MLFHSDEPSEEHQELLEIRLQGQDTQPSGYFLKRALIFLYGGLMFLGNR